jgi:hypothetical protein
MLRPAPPPSMREAPACRRMIWRFALPHGFTRLPSGAVSRDWLDYEDAHGYIRVRLYLIPAEEGGRNVPIWSDYRCSWDIGAQYEGKKTINDAPLTLEDVEKLEPGQIGFARLHPIARQFWDHVQPGLAIYAYEGSRLVGVAEVVERRMSAHSDTSAH